MNKRGYPLFLIDRTKNLAYPFDYITCFDKTVGFISRVEFFKRDVEYFEFVTNVGKIENSEFFNLTMKLKEGGLILFCEDFLYSFDLTQDNKNRVKTLLKKALKKYLHAEIDRTAFDDLGIDNQIKMQQQTIDKMRQNYDLIIAQSNGDASNADYMIAVAEATLKTLKSVRDRELNILLN